MTRRIVFANFHSIEERQSVEMYSNLGYEVVSLGAYLIPREPSDPKRPPLDIDPPPDEIVEACRDTHAAKFNYPPVLLDWLGDDGILISHHFLPETIFAQWHKLKGRRVIWRSDGQNMTGNEVQAQYYRDQGLERVAYSPAESNIPGYSGHDAVIRFGYDPEEWQGWTGDEPTVINVTQHMKARGAATNWPYWEASTQGLKRLPMGPGSDEIGGPGEVPFDDMKAWLRNARAYLYTGTQPASYTLGLIEAGMTGIPIVCIGRAWMNFAPYSPELFEAPDLLPLGGFDDPAIARAVLKRLLNDHDFAREISARQREMFVANFGREKIEREWGAYLEGGR